MRERNFAADLKEYVERNPKLVKARSIGDGLYILKYTRHVFFKGLWDEYLEECRGTVVDSDFNVVSRPFTKIYNYGIDKESPQFSDDTVVDAIRKVNGFLVNVSMYNGELLVTSSGSASGPHVDMAMEYIAPKEFILKNMLKINLQEKSTMMFECVHPSDPHIINEEKGLYLLGIRDNSWYSEVVYSKHATLMANLFLRVNLPEYHEKVTIGELKEMNRNADHEGFVFYTEDGQSAKMKSPYYLAAKFLARLGNTDKLFEKDIDKRVDEEFYPLIEAVRKNINEFTELDEQERLAWIKKYFDAQQ
mgnify:CR=1 FL=1